MSGLNKPTAAEAAYLQPTAANPLGWAKDMAADARSDFAEAGLPHRRLENWQWTDLKRLITGAYPPITSAACDDAAITQALKAAPLAGIASARLVFVDGAFIAEQSNLATGNGIEVATLKEGEKPDWLDFTVIDTDPIDRLNLAHLTDGAAIRVSGEHAAPIELIFINQSNQATMTIRNMLVIEDNASATVFESHFNLNADDYVANNVTEVHLGNKARLDRVKIQDEGAQAFHLANLVVRLGDYAKLNDFTLSKGGRLTRQQGFVTMAGEFAEAHLSGVYLQQNTQHTDTRLVVDHAVPNGISRELFKCVMADEARGIFQGKVIVRPDAQKTDGKQSSHALLLSPMAEFDAKPELEIYADDVVCGHGATSGELDEEPLFYLMARGIPETTARAMLVEAFVGEAFDTIENDTVRDVLRNIAHNWLAD